MTTEPMPCSDRRRCRDCRTALPPQCVWRCPACALASIARLEANADR
jgi:hypothetical protein